MIIWEKVTIQDSSAKFSLALDSNHSGLRLSDANDNDANLSLNQLTATNFILGSTGQGLEYNDSLGNFIFNSPVHFDSVVHATSGLTTREATINNSLIVSGAANINGKLTVNNSIKTAGTIEGNDNLTLSFHNGSVFQIQCSTGNNAENIIDSDGLDITCYKTLQVNGDCSIANKIQASNIGDLIFPPTLWIDTGNNWTRVCVLGSTATYKLTVQNGSKTKVSGDLSTNTVHTVWDDWQVLQTETFSISFKTGTSYSDPIEIHLPFDPAEHSGDGIYIDLSTTCSNYISAAHFNRASVIAKQSNCGAVVGDWHGGTAKEDRLNMWAWAIQAGYKYFFYYFDHAWYGGELQASSASDIITHFLGTIYFATTRWDA